MKISKQRLLQILKEEMEPKDLTKITAGSMGQAQYKKSALQGVETAQEFTGQERKIVDQIQKFITDVANTEGVDLMQHKSLLERILKYLQKSLTGSAKPEAGEEQ